ncbi:MAG: DUF305 domain-containing protein [Nitriliruptor sp.]
MSVRTARVGAVVVVVGLALGAHGAVAAEDGPIYVRPGAPGEPTQRISPRDVAVPRSAPYSHHEVHFMQHMMVHHGQAITMSALAPDRAADERVLTLARRIGPGQGAEIDQMARWLELRGEDVPDPFDTHGHEGMPGMVSEEEMAALEASEGRMFDIRFLEAMIEHHYGAITMVHELEAATGTYVEPNVSVLMVEIVDLQETEIKRMQRLLEELRS